MRRRVGSQVGSHGIRAWWCSISSADYKGKICTRKSWIYTKQGFHSLARTILVRLSYQLVQDVGHHLQESPK